MPTLRQRPPLSSSGITCASAPSTLTSASYTPEPASLAWNVSPLVPCTDCAVTSAPPTSPTLGAATCSSTTSTAYTCTATVKRLPSLPVPHEYSVTPTQPAFTYRALATFAGGTASMLSLASGWLGLPARAHPDDGVHWPNAYVALLMLRGPANQNE